ncbi:MAG: hypothetical protein LDL33_00615 [Desulfomonile sp.]|nr:hypothetical protein [Desulfomonile sp.]
MSDTVQIIAAAVLLVAVFVLTRLGIMRKMIRAAGRIIEDLESKGAVDEESAVAVPYAQTRLIRLGMRDYMAKALDYLVTDGTVGKTADGRYYLRVRPAEISRRDTGADLHSS